MGRNSGGVSGSSASNSGGAGKKGATEEGYSAKMVKNILGIEQRYRNNSDETLHIFNGSGGLVKSIGGKGTSVTISGDIPENSILTHNHPRSIGKKGILKIGNSFSGEDIRTAVNCNAREIRAVTPTYTFSLKRPKGGWGVSAKRAYDIWKAANDAVYKSNDKHLRKRGYSQTAIDRATTAHYHQVMKMVADELGWKYSKKRG